MRMCRPERFRASLPGPHRARAGNFPVSLQVAVSRACWNGPVSGVFAVPRLIARLVLLAVLVLPARAIADDRCAVPLADWQPREVLRAELERAGWSEVKIRTDDGCYKVIGIDPGGRRLKARFHPATLEPVARGGHDHRRHDDDRD